MQKNSGYTIEVSSSYEGWWRYNVALMCGCFDAEDNRIGFASAESHLADVGDDLKKRPIEIPAERRVSLSAESCDHLMLYVYIIPHTLPSATKIEDAKPFEIELKITCDGHKIKDEKRLINQWSGASIEMRVDAPQK